MNDAEKVLLELESAAEWYHKRGENENKAIIGILKRAAGLIKEQRAENERYKGVIKILENDVKGARESVVKEFSHLLIDKAESGGVIHAMDIPDYVVDFLKEDKDEDRNLI